LEPSHSGGRPGFDLRRPACARCCQFSSIMVPNSDSRAVLILLRYLSA
jgi:hypothetical protein